MVSKTEDFRAIHAKLPPNVSQGSCMEPQVLPGNPTGICKQRAEVLFFWQTDQRLTMNARTTLATVGPWCKSA